MAIYFKPWKVLLQAINVNSFKMILWAHKREKFFHGRKYTPLYEKGIKEFQNNPMETALAKNLSIVKKFNWQILAVSFMRNTKLFLLYISFMSISLIC